jgi:protein-disulfide isomerase
MAGDPKLRVVWKEWPILGPMSEVAARAAIAVHRLKPDAYLAFHDTLMSDRGRLTEQEIFQTVTELGLTADQVRAEMGRDEVTTYLAGNQALAQTLGITGTPFFLIGDTAVPGAIGADQMRALIAEARTKNDG